MLRKFSGAVFALALSSMVLVQPAISADGGRSIYSKIDIDGGTCRLGRVYEEGQGGEWWCPGFSDGMEILVAEGDLRYFLGYGPNAARQISFKQTLPPFNIIGKTMEWRVRVSAGTQVPYATILRYHTDENGYKGQILVVTKIGHENACHIAFIDARLNHNANALARHAADTMASGFDCLKDVAITLGVRR